MSDKEKEIKMIEENRSRMHQIIDERYDELIACMKSGRSFLLQRRLSLASDPCLLKGKKPVSIVLPDGQLILTPSWKSAAAAILKDCNADAERHSQMMELRGAAGRFRSILSHDPTEMDKPIKIDNNLYFEGKFDTEYLIKMMIEKVLKPVGYDYSGIVVTFREKQPAISVESEEGAPTEDQDEDERFSMQMM